MELASAVISLALVVKQQADDATENIALCHSLSSRAEMIPRLLEKFPDKSNLDVALLSRIFEQLKSCHDLINQYRKKGALMRFIKAGTMKSDFQDLESSLGRSIDDLTLAVGVSSAIVLDSIRNDFQQFFQKFNNDHHLLPVQELETVTEIEQEVARVGSFFIAPTEVTFGEVTIHHSVPQLLPLRAREGVHQGKGVFVREYLISTKSEDLPSLLAQLTPLLDLLAQISHTESGGGAGCEVCPIIGWGYQTSPLTQASPSFPDTLVTLYLISDLCPSYGSTLTEFMKAHPTGLSGNPTTEELLLRISYSLIKNIAFLQYQCSLWEGRGRDGETLRWAKGVSLLPRNLLIDSTGSTMLLLFDSFLPLVPVTELAAQSSFRREFLNCAPLSRFCLECAECDPREICIWCAPEQMKLSSLSDFASATSASDIYAFGLVLSYLSTGQLPHDPLALQPLDLKERVRQGRPQNTPRDGSLLSEVISYCVSSEPSSRPDALSLYRIMLSLCQERRIEVSPLVLSSHVHSSLSPQDSRKLKAATSTEESSEDEGSESGLADFGELAEKVEQLSQSIKLFGSPYVSPATKSPPSPVVVIYGSKVIFLNLPASNPQSALDSSQRSIVHDDEEEEAEVSGGVAAGEERKQRSGVVIFHIDNTASMKKDNRMKLVKEMLVAVVPKYVQLNYSIIVNSWSSTEETKGRIQVCRALNDLPPALLEKEHRAEFESFMEETLFKPYLSPNGRTDLYGSCYQLLRQIEGELREHSLPIYSIVLTDGNHNRLDYPLHAPSAKGEEYFGVYKATLNNGTKFGLNPGATFDLPHADLFLKSHLESVLALCGEINERHQSSPTKASVSLVIIGIGEASTQSLSALASTLGESCSFYGISRTEEVLPIFNSLTESSGVDDQVALRLASSEQAAHPTLSFRYVLETDERLVGCHVLSDQVAVEKLHTAPELCLSYKDNIHALPACPHLTSVSSTVKSPPSQNPHLAETEEKSRRRLTEIVRELVSILSRLRAEPYEVTSETFTSVFKRLQADKKVLTSLKLLHSSKQLRSYRHLSIYLGLGVWIREMDEMVEAQISAYRMNVETEMLAQLGDSSVAGRDEGGAFEPSAVVLERLQNNMRNSGRPVHKVSRHLASIQTLRDRTLPMATSILSADLSLRRTAVGLAVDVLHPQTGKAFQLEWSAVDPSSPSAEAEVELSLVEHIQNALLTEPLSSLPSTSASSTLSSSLSSETHLETQTQHLRQMCESESQAGPLEAQPVTFPCILLRAHFDPFTIVRNSSLFNTVALFPSPRPLVEPPASPLHRLCCPVYCLEDIWDLLCYSSNGYFPGQDLPLLVSLETNTASTLSSLRDQRQSSRPSLPPNMAIALGHTPLLFQLYVERSCLYQSCLNVTGDLMAYASTTFQWAKLFYDCLYFVPHLDSTLANSKATAKNSAASGAVEECWSPEDDEERARVADSLRRTHLEVGLMALVSYSYACEFRRTSPSESTVHEMFGQSLPSETGPAATSAPATGLPYQFFTRESFPGLTGPLGLATLLASSELYPFAREPLTWTSLLLTLFSRFCEAISGGKVIRSNDPSVADLRELEEAYRLLIGQIQSTLQRRLLIDWPKLQLAEKLHLISLCSHELVAILRTLVTSFLERFGRYGLPLWSEVLGVVQGCLALQRVSVSSLREMFRKCDGPKVDSVIRDLLLTLSAGQSQLLLPVVRVRPAASPHGSEGLFLTELDPDQDPLELLGYVEAILATKVSPKIEYKPVLKAEHPSLAADLNRQLRVTSLLSAWNTENAVVSLGLIGNVNSGKSTLSGRILYDLGLVDKRLVERLSEEARRLGYTSELKYAWILDRLREERARSVTVIPKFAAFETHLRRYTLIDLPGHKDFLKNITGGIFRTDVALLIISGVESERNVSGLVSNYVEEYLVNAFCYSIKHLVVVVNKMDAVAYAESEFQAACESVKKALKKAGYKTSGANKSIQFVPLSGLTGEGILSTSASMPWYQGPCLLQLLDEVVIPKRLTQKPLRMVVSDTHKIAGVGTVLCGKIECGTLSVGETLCCFPDPGPASVSVSSSKGRGKASAAAASAHTFNVKSIESHNLCQHSASAGEDVGIAISGGSGISVKSFTKGMILTLSSNPPVPLFRRFEAQLIVLKSCTIRCGYAPTLLINSALVPVRVTRLVSLIDKNNAILETSPESVSQSQICICEMEALKAFAAETIHDIPKLSKFLIRESRQTVAIGFIRGAVA